jgi:hypothetical protein
MNSLRSSADVNSGGTLLNRRLSPVSLLTERLMFSTGSLWRGAIPIDSEKSFIGVRQANDLALNTLLPANERLPARRVALPAPRAQLRHSRDNFQG